MRIGKRFLLEGKLTIRGPGTVMFGDDVIVTDGVEGYVVEPRDPEQLAHALLRLARDRAMRTRMGSAGRTRIEAGSTLDTQLQDFLRMYHEVAG